MLLDVTRFFAYSLPGESLHFPEGFINVSVACRCSPCQRAEVRAGAALAHWPPRWVRSSPPNNPRSSLLPGVHAPLSYVATRILLPQICMSITGQVRFKQAHTIQIVVSSHVAALGRQASGYTSLRNKDTRQSNSQIMSKVKCKLRTDVSTEPVVRAFQASHLQLASQLCIRRVNSFSTVLPHILEEGVCWSLDTLKNQECLLVWV